MKYVSVALIFAATLASTSAVIFPRDDYYDGKDYSPDYHPKEKSQYYPEYSPYYTTSAYGSVTTKGYYDEHKPSQCDDGKKDGHDAHETGKPYPAGHTTRDVSCDGQHRWQMDFAYSSGEQVVFNNQLWKANQWNYNSPPGNPAAAWTLVDVCNPQPTDNANCAGASPWNKGAAYPRGSQVTFNNHLWASVQWTSSNSPGDTSGTWKDLGACVSDGGVCPTDKCPTVGGTPCQGTCSTVPPKPCHTCST